MSLTRSLGALAIVVALGAAGFLLGRELLNDGGTQARDPSTVDRLDALKTAEAQAAAQPRFNGELIGIYVAPSLEQVPKNFWEENVRLAEAGCVPGDLAAAEDLAFPREFTIPQGFDLAESDSANTGMNPWALSCSGELRSRGWDYVWTRDDGIPASVAVIRAVIRYDTQDAAESQVSVEHIGGREAVVIHPLSPDGLGQRTLIYFPEAFGMTTVQGVNLPEEDVLRVAEAVAEATR